MRYSVMTVLAWIKKRWWWAAIATLAVVCLATWKEIRCERQEERCRAYYTAQQSRLYGFSVIDSAAEHDAINEACEPNGYFCRLFSASNLPNFLLVLVGIGGICAAIKTLRTLEDQTQAAFLNATSALRSVDFYISKERARLAVDLKPPNLKDRAVSGNPARMVEFTVSIYGSTAATILDSGLVSGIFIKGQESEPGLGSAVISPISGLPSRMLPNTPPLELMTFLFIEESIEGTVLEAIQREEMVPVVRGFVRYQDVFETRWTLHFRCYWGPSEYNIPGLAWDDVNSGQWLKCGTPEENQESKDTT